MFFTKQPPAKAGGFRRRGRGLKVRKEWPRLQKPLDLTDVPLVGDALEGGAKADRLKAGGLNLGSDVPPRF
jgi:hypothetical protein